MNGAWESAVLAGPATAGGTGRPVGPIVNSEDLMLIDIVRSVLTGHGEQGWLVAPAQVWCYVEPPNHSVRPQGWKLHISATPLSAPTVLVRAAQVLVRHRCAFKFARSLDQVEELVSSLTDRSAGGKFITVYPESTGSDLRALAAELHRATQGLPGPGILSDRSYCDKSLVHYRFGVFGGVNVLGNDGSYEAMLTAPDGSLLLDQRNPWYAAPAFASRDPFDEQPAAASESNPTPKPVMLGGRYLVDSVIRHSFSGGVYRGRDTQTDSAVVIKQGRPHTAADRTGGDIRHARRHEADMLRRFRSSGHTPRLVEVFEQQGELFLVQELITGRTLREWATEQATTRGDDEQWGPEPDQAIRLAEGLVELIDAVHADGLVARDFNPNNVMVTPDQQPRLIDLELWTTPGELVARGFTPGYGAPEVVSAPRFGPAAGPAADLYGLGATLFHLVSGADPLFAPDDAQVRPVARRAEAALAQMSIDSPAARLLAPIIVGLLADDPAGRPTLPAVRAALAALAAKGATGDRPAGTRATGARATGARATGARPARIRPASAHPRGPAETSEFDVEPDPSTEPGPSFDRILMDGFDHLSATAEFSNPRRLWAAGSFAQTTDPCNVQHGAAGVLGVLTRAQSADPDHRRRSLLVDAAGWITRRMSAEPRVLPGLYFGRSGTAWALLEAAKLLADNNIEQAATDLALRVPVRWPNPDVCHGTSGAGLMFLRLWEITGDTVFLDRAVLAAESVLAAQQVIDGQLLWPIPTDFASTLAGLRHYGFAHGVAGIGSFLLAAGRLTGDPRFLDSAIQASQTLVGAAHLDKAGARWPAGPGSPALATNWCSGSSGVGTFLARMWQETGEPQLRQLAEQAARAVRRSRWTAGTAQCHGLAGEGEFLLDIAEIFDEPRYRDWADELATSIALRFCVRAGRVLIPDDGGLDVTADYNTGLSGVLAFFHRLRHGGQRLWLPAVLG